MRLIFIGPPGSGKGTQAKLLSDRQGLAHIATGDILRDAIQNDTPEGRLAKPYVAAGQLVPDDIVNEIIYSRFRAPGAPRCFVMDGYPRTLAQATAFDKVLHEYHHDLDGVIFLKVADEEIVKRLSARWTCPNPVCKATFHTIFKPPAKAGVCDQCGTALFQRADDQAETVAKRLKIFHDIYDALLDHYRKVGLLIEVPGIGDIETIYASIVKALADHKIR